MENSTDSPKPFRDDDLIEFEAHGAPALPGGSVARTIEHAGARIWYQVCGAGEPVVLLHGGLGHSGNWGFQVPALVDAGRQVVVVDSRGHGRSTRDARAFTYQLMAADVLRVLDELKIRRAAVVGWSDGACTALVMAMQAPERVSGVFFFGCNMDPSGTKEIDGSNPLLGRCMARHKRDYDALSATPGQFQSFFAAVGQMMATEPNVSAPELAAIKVPVAVVQSEFDEFIKPEHAAYLAATIPDAQLITLPGVSHFAPVQRPDEFNAALLSFLKGLK